MSDKPLRSWGDSIFRGMTFGFAAGIPLLFAWIVLCLWRESQPAVRKFGLAFLTSTAWNPVQDDFGALTAIAGTFASTLLALLLAVPLSIGTAVFLAELAPTRLRGVFGICIELLAAVPSIVYGMWGLFILSPLIADYLQPGLTATLGFLPLFQGPPIGIGVFTAALVLSVMILPFMASVCRDALLMVPTSLKEAAYGVGCTKWEVVRGVMIPYCRQGIAGGVFLGTGRALGETMAVTFVIGNAHRFSWSLFAPGSSIASTLANEFTEADSEIYLASLIALGLVLFLITFVVLAVAQWWLHRSSLKPST